MGDEAQISSLQDSGLSASSVYTSDQLDTSQSRLYSISGGGSWASASNSVGQWIQASLSQPKWIHKVATQGRHNIRQWVTSYQLQHSLSNSEQDLELLATQNGSVITFNGNTDSENVVVNSFPAVFAQYVRLLPLTCESHISLRWEIFACVTG